MKIEATRSSVPDTYSRYASAYGFRFASVSVRKSSSSVWSPAQSEFRHPSKPTTILIQWSVPRRPSLLDHVSS